MSETNPHTTPSEDVVHGEVLGSLLSISVAARNPSISPEDLQKRIEVLERVTAMLPIVTTVSVPLHEKMAAPPPTPSSSDPLIDSVTPQNKLPTSTDGPHLQTLTPPKNISSARFEKKWLWPAGATACAVLILALGSISAEDGEAAPVSSTLQTSTTVPDTSIPQEVATTQPPSPTVEVLPTSTTQVISERAETIEPSPDNITIQVLG